MTNVSISRSYSESVSKETLQGMMCGDRDSMTKAYLALQPFCFGYFRSKVLDTCAAEDLTQEAFLRVFRDFARYDLNRDFTAWLLGICRNVFREYVRKLSGRREIMWSELCLDLAEAVDDEVGLYEELLPLVSVCMSRLAPNSRAVLSAHYRDGKKVAEIAVDMQRSLSAVKMQMLRARKAIKGCIRKAMHGSEL